MVGRGHLRTWGGHVTPAIPEVCPGHLTPVEMEVGAGHLTPAEPEETKCEDKALEVTSALWKVEQESRCFGTVSEI